MLGQTMNENPVTPALCASEVMEHAPFIMRLIRAEMRRQGTPFLSIPQFRALTYIYRHPGGSLTAVSEHLGVTLPTASAITDRLVRHGLVARATDPEERRRITLTLTPEGLELYQRARAATRDYVASILADLTDEQLATTLEGIRLLGNAFRRAASAKC
ncbi:MAG TPA: MarR family transcriptional regulator [Chloroflexota bacterium]|nr:MarR family transcriptional regulator [Chloroflexota bacterium]